MGEVDRKRMHEGLMALAIGGPSGYEAGMMGLLESIDVGERRVDKSAQCAAFCDYPLPNPSVACGSGSLLSDVRGP